MFNLEIEKKIIGFVKKGPLGVSSSDIAHYVGLNRMTITKYLAIIKERALIDFKQFGMAKLWYIPVKLSKESFLSRIMAYMVKSMPKEELKSFSEKAGIRLGEEINQMYILFYDTEKLTLSQICDTYQDIGKKLNGLFKVTSQPKKISIEILRSPFEEKEMNTILSAVFAKIASLSLGYARAVVVEPEGEGNVVIDIFLKKKEKQ